MRTCDIDTSGRVWVYTPESHKTEHHGRERRIYLGPTAQAILRPWLRPELTAYLFSPAEAEAERRAEQRRNRKTPGPTLPAEPAEASSRGRLPGRSTTRRSYRQAIEYGIEGQPEAGQAEAPGTPILAPEPTPPQRGDSAPSGVRPGRGPGRVGPYLPGRDGGLRGAGRGQSGGGDGTGGLRASRQRSERSHCVGPTELNGPELTN